VVATQAALSAIVLSLTFALSPGMGVDGVGVAWLTAQVAVAVALTPWLWHTLRGAPR
jgi:Na+-driven multidrug efflux pump